jgi:hypothetical protein
MIKKFLALSLVTNFILGYFLLTKKTEKEIVERVIVETHQGPQASASTVSSSKLPTEKNNAPKVEKVAIEPSEIYGIEQEEVQEAGEKMESDRLDFFTSKLGMSEDKISEHNKLRDDFFKKTSLFWQKNPLRELSFDERRQMLLMEEDFYRKLEKLHGKKNWERYQKFRENYNQKGYKKQLDEGTPFIFMGL